MKDYADIDHGYAATIHKAQGVTVDRVHVLATPGLDRHATYVALSRHRDRVDLHYGEDDFDSRDRLVRMLARERSKDMASDHLPERSPVESRRNPFAGIRPREGPIEPALPRPRDPFAGIRMRPIPFEEPTTLDRAVERAARAVRAVKTMRAQGHEPLIYHRTALEQAAQALDKLRPDAAHDLGRVFRGQPALIEEAAQGRTRATIQAMQLETEIRIDTAQRADRFVSDWQKQVGRYLSCKRSGQIDAADRLASGLTAMAKSLERDPQLESLLRNRRIALGLKASGSASLSHDLQDYLGLSRGRGLGR